MPSFFTHAPFKYPGDTSRAIGKWSPHQCEITPKGNDNCVACIAQAFVGAVDDAAK